MIFIHDKIYAKVWKVDKKEKYIDLQVTTSEKDNDGNYVNSGWFPRLIGHAFNSLKDKIKEGDRLVITKAKMTNERYKDDEGNTKSRGLKFVVLEASVDAPSKNNEPQETTPAPAAQPQGSNDNKDACPW